MANITLDLYADFTQSADPYEITLSTALPKITALVSNLSSYDGTGWAMAYTMSFYANTVSEYTKFLSMERFEEGYSIIDSSFIDRLSGASKIIIAVSNWATAARGRAYITLIVQDEDAHIEKQVTKNTAFTTIDFSKSLPVYGGILSITDIGIRYSSTFSQSIPFTLYAGTTSTASQQIGTGQFVGGSNSATITLDEEKAKDLLANEYTIRLVAQSNAPAGTYTFTFDYVAYVKKHVIYVDEYQGGTALFMCTARYYDGTKFVPCFPHYYDGTQWIPCNYESQII